MTEHEKFMQLALAQAQAAFAENEVPVGAVLVKDGRLVCSAHNRMRQSCDPTAHAELLVLQSAAKLLNGRFDDCTLYATLEPCAMCAGAIVNCKLPKLVFGAFDDRAGCCGSVADLTDHWFLHSVETWGGVCETACSHLLTDFFSSKRCNP